MKAQSTTLDWLRRNLALVIALFSLIASGSGWYASYAVLNYRVDMNREFVREMQQTQQEIAKTLTQHLANGDIHVNPTLRTEIFNRLGRIENLLLQMNRKDMDR